MPAITIPRAETGRAELHRQRARLGPDEFALDRDGDGWACE